MNKKIKLVLLLLLIEIKCFGIFVLPIKYSEIQLLITNKLPEGGTLVCAANFTKNYNILEPINKRLVYSCVSNGNYYKREAPKNIGVFTWYNNEYHFSYNKENLTKALKNNGMGFLQWMVVYNYKPCKLKTYSTPQHFRVLAEKHDRLYFIEADTCLTFSDFLKELKKLNVKNAIYLDTGEGWQTYYYVLNGVKHTKYRTPYIFPFRTNVLYFKEEK